MPLNSFPVSSSRKYRRLVKKTRLAQLILPSKFVTTIISELSAMAWISALSSSTAARTGNPHDSIVCLLLFIQAPSVSWRTLCFRSMSIGLFARGVVLREVKATSLSSHHLGWPSHGSQVKRVLTCPRVTGNQLESRGCCARSGTLIEVAPTEAESLKRK